MAQYASPRSNFGETSAGGVAEQAEGAARDVAEEARAAGASLRREVGGLGSTIKQGLSDQVERRKNGIADRLSTVAERVQATAGDLREHEVWLGSLLGRGASELQGIAEEIRRNDVPGILGSVEVFARRQPALFMGATVALGFALTRFVGAGPVERDDRSEAWRDDYRDAFGDAARDLDPSSIPGRPSARAGMGTGTAGYASRVPGSGH